MSVTISSFMFIDGIPSFAACKQIIKKCGPLLPFLSLSLSLVFFLLYLCGSLRLKVFCVLVKYWLKLSGGLRWCSVSAGRLLRFICTDQSERPAARLTSLPSSFDSLFWCARAPQRNECRTPHTVGFCQQTTPSDTVVRTFDLQTKQLQLKTKVVVKRVRNLVHSFYK